MLIAHVYEEEACVYVRASGEGDPTEVDWEGVLQTGWTVMLGLRHSGIAAYGLTVVDLEARVPARSDP